MSEHTREHKHTFNHRNKDCTIPPHLTDETIDKNSSSVSFLLIFLTSEWCDNIRYWNFFFLDRCFVVYFWGPSTSNKALNTIPPQFSSWRRVKVYGSVGACKTFPPCVKELSLKQVGVNMCEPFMSLADIYFFFFFSPHCSGSLGAYCTVRQILSMKTTSIPLLTPIVSSDCYDTVTLVGAN